MARTPALAKVGVIPKANSREHVAAREHGMAARRHFHAALPEQRRDHPSGRGGLFVPGPVRRVASPAPHPPALPPGWRTMTCHPHG